MSFMDEKAASGIKCRSAPPRRLPEANPMRISRVLLKSSVLSDRANSPIREIRLTRKVEVNASIRINMLITKESKAV